MSGEGVIASSPVLVTPSREVVDAGRARLAGSRRWVIKLGSALLTADGRGVDPERLAAIARPLSLCCQEGQEVVLVSSGAVAEGVSRLRLPRRPVGVHELQAAAAVGQMGLIQAWESAFATHGRHTALILLTHDDLADRARYLNARTTLRTLLGHGVVPVINENDTVATEEIRFGDNDSLAALVANLIEADALVLLTDIDGLRESDPRVDPVAPRVKCARASDPALDGMVGSPAGALGRGGMQTKLRAARIAARSGAVTAIADGRAAGVLEDVMGGRDAGTLLLPDQVPLAARKRWIAGQLQTRGLVQLDDGAVRVLKNSGRSLLPVGVTKAVGDFRRGDVVRCVDGSGTEIARGLVNYSATETRLIAGLGSHAIVDRLGYVAEPELIHRDNLVLS